MMMMDIIAYVFHDDGDGAVTRLFCVVYNRFIIFKDSNKSIPGLIHVCITLWINEK